MILFVAFAAAVGCRLRAERVATAPALPSTHFEVPGRLLRIASLSFDSLVADVLWIRFVAAIPLRPADPAEGRVLASQLNAVVELDPAFRSAYYQGSIILGVMGNQPCSALRILDRGMERFPDDWRLPFQAGYNCFVEVQDPECAARNMQRAASLPGSPGWLPALTARLMAEATQEEAAIDYLRAQLERTEDPRLRDRFEQRLAEAYLARDLRRLQEAVDTYRKRRRIAPSGWEALVGEGLLPGPPGRDPFGGEYGIDGRGRVVSSSGREPLRAFVRQHQFVGEVGERILEERVIARLPAEFGFPPFIRTGVEAVEAHSGSLVSALRGLETLIRHDLTRTKADRLDLRVLQARTLLRMDLDRLRAAWRILLRESAPESVSIERIAAEAGVPLHDAFGSPFRLGEDGQPSPDARRHPIVAISSHGGHSYRSAEGVAACQ